MRFQIHRTSAFDKLTLEYRSGKATETALAIFDGAFRRLAGPLGELERSVAAEVAPLAALRARHGVFFVTGNHDHFSGANQWVSMAQSLGMPTSVRALDISEEAFNQAMPALIENTETDTQMVSSCRVPDTREVEALFRYAYEGKSIDF